MLCRADSVGVFQVESRAQMATLPRLKPRTFYDLVVEVALIRPGPIQGGSVHPYIRRRNGKEPVTYLHPLLETQPAQDARRAAVPGAAHADGHRRRRLHAGRGRPAAPGHGVEAQPRADGAPALAALRGHGRARHHRRGGRPDLREAGRVRQLRLPREPLGVVRLPRLLGSWIKLHYPAAFCAALLNAQPMGFYSPHTLVQDARRHGVEVLGPDLNASGAKAILEVGA